jgi:type IV pilus assembly protein PilB
MSAVSASSSLTGLARALVGQGLLSERDADNILSRDANGIDNFVPELLRTTKLKSLQVAEFAARTFSYPYLDLNALDPESIPQRVLDAKLMQKRRVVALFGRGNKLFVGVSDPTNLQALDEVKFQTGLAIEPIVVEDDKLGKLIDKVESEMDNTMDVLNSEELDLEFSSEDTPLQQDTAGIEIDDAPVVRYLQKIMLDAINTGASDIHLEPYEKFYRIRYRRDGVLYEVAQPPLAIKDKLASRIKVISKLDISEKRVPQDGRVKMVLSRNRQIDFRVSTLPTLYGEKIVMRILDPTSAQLGIEALGYEPWQRKILLDAVQRPYGMVLVTGPTGSGKTVSLYTCLNILNQPGVNISTAEDPAEIQLAGVNQVNVNEKAGLTFATALRSFLRQDPDVIMVGEIRDLETADIAIKAAQTGHMVLSTVHTNDASSTLTRLLNMGVAPFNVASSVICITAQRLARKLCSCKKPVDIPREALVSAGFDEDDLDGSWQTYGPGGCELCQDSGYKGRTGIYQVMPITDEMTRIILKNGTSVDIADQAKREGVLDLRQAGLLKVKAGITSLEEVEAVTNM